MNASRGFTLVELLVFLVVAGLILAIGTPSFGKYRSSLALKQAKNQILEDVRTARQFAVTRRAPVYMRIGVPPSTSDITSYRIHVDSNANGVVDAGERQYARTLPRFSRLASVSLNPVDTLVFDISGILRPGTTGGTLVFANNRGLRDTLAVSAAGIVYRP